jgi:hypothetical protein
MIHDLLSERQECILAVYTEIRHGYQLHNLFEPTEFILQLSCLIHHSLSGTFWYHDLNVHSVKLIFSAKTTQFRQKVYSAIDIRCSYVYCCQLVLVIVTTVSDITASISYLCDFTSKDVCL